MKVSDESGKKFQECSVLLRTVHEVFSREIGNTAEALFDSVRLYMIVAAAHIALSDPDVGDEELRTILHNLLELAINDYQFNERLHVGSKGAS